MTPTVPDQGGVPEGSEPKTRPFPHATFEDPVPSWTAEGRMEATQTSNQNLYREKGDGHRQDGGHPSVIESSVSVGQGVDSSWGWTLSEPLLLARQFMYIRSLHSHHSDCFYLFY